MVESYWVL